MEEFTKVDYVYLTWDLKKSGTPLGFQVTCEIGRVVKTVWVYFSQVEVKISTETPNIYMTLSLEFVCEDPNQLCKKLLERFERIADRTDRGLYYEPDFKNVRVEFQNEKTVKFRAVIVSVISVCDPVELVFYLFPKAVETLRNSMNTLPNSDDCVWGLPKPQIHRERVYASGMGGDIPEAEYMARKYPYFYKVPK